MGAARQYVERIVKSFGFSLTLFALWGGLTALKARSLFDQFASLECAWVLYNATIAILFVVRSRPSVVSLNPVHWLVALVTSFAGLFFARTEQSHHQPWHMAADALLWLGLLAGLVAALALGRSYDFLPALRGVQTGWLYRVVRHPMYASSILIRLAYLVQNPSWYNLIVFAVMVWLYDRRASYEEDIMSEAPRYRAYTEQVRFRFLPGIY